MSAVSVVTDASTVDWNIVAGAVATFIITAILTWQGIRKGRRNVESGKSELTPIVGASLIESTSMIRLSEGLRDAAAALRENTAELRRCNDLTLMNKRK